MNIPDKIRPALQCVVYVAPFLAHLAMALRWRMDSSISTACTNGAEVRVNEAFFDSLTNHEQAGLMAHEALHCALRHPARGQRLITTPTDAARFNIAADIVVNAACANAGLTLPKGSIRDRRLEHLAVEEIFRLIKVNSRQAKMGRGIGAKLRDLDCEDANHNAIDDGSEHEDEIDWPNVIRRADILARRHGKRQGTRSLNIERELEVAIGEPEIDWRTVLWRFLGTAQNDWSGWDRRFIHTNTYLPTLAGQGLRAVVGIDVSGSVNDELLNAFLTELSGITQVVDNLHIDLYWADTQLHGPHKLNRDTDITSLKREGGGGTDLAPLFVQAEATAIREGLSDLPTIYLTDGYGSTLSEEPASVSALWVIPTDQNTNQPWGTIVPMKETL